MRFDYHPPNAKFKAFHIRRLLLAYTILIGLGCIAYTSFIQNTNYEVVAEQPVIAEATKKPTLLSSNKTKVLPAIAKTSSVNKPIIAQVPPVQPILNSDHWQTITVQVGDTFSKLFERLGISKLSLSRLVSSGITMEELAKIYPGQKLDFLFDDSKELKAVKLNLSSTKTLHVTNDGSKFKYSYEEKLPTKKLNFSGGKITGSLYSSAQSAGLDERLIMEMADIFGYDIDFTLDIRDNDSFRVLYEEEYLQDKKIHPGKILAVEFNNQGKLYKAVRYTDAKGRDGFYSPEGYSLQKAFLRSPVEFTRISSHFSSGRRHPILHKIRAHRGVDYAAPIGTPVKAAGDGRISFMGTKGGYGKAIEVTHGQKYSTFYAHLSRFHKKIRHGTFVKQGQIIGYVGKTGLASGPHLHYEFRINGVHHNPVTVSLPSSQPISTKEKATFTSHATQMFNLLDFHSKEAVNE